MSSAVGKKAGPVQVRANSPAIEMAGVSRTYHSHAGSFLALDGVEFSVPSGEFLSIVGPSGCGKSTLLSLIAGLAPTQTGSVQVAGEAVTRVRPDVGFIFQSDALLPWRTALQNVSLPLRFRGAKRREAEETAAEWLDKVGLGKFTDRYPHQLSGGMRKRVSIATTLAYKPSVLLLDEPFSALDVQTRTLMESDLLGLWEVDRPTVVFITHDLEEAIALSDRVLVMSASPGRIIGDHRISIERPRNILEIRFEPEFTDLHHRIWGQLRDEVLKAREV